MRKDLVTEIVRERTAKNPAFPRLVKEAEVRRKLARKLTVVRERSALSQTVVAARTPGSTIRRRWASGHSRSRSEMPSSKHWKTFERVIRSWTNSAPGEPPMRSL